MKELVNGNGDILEDNDTSGFPCLREKSVKKDKTEAF